MRHVSFCFAVVSLCCVASPGADAAPGRNREQAQRVPQSREALYQNCRVMVFRKFGWNYGTGKIVMYTDYLIEQTDLCVRNGGRI